ncbi:MAG TPA: ion channel [Caulobacteraceae bacterium]|nr:ion channel [Caulobacteraceae bacterium]
MIVQLALSTLMVLLTVVIHGFGLAIFGRYLRNELREEIAHHTPPLSPRTLVFTLALVLALFALHGIEIWLYAAVYVGLGAIHDLSTAVYFSTITYGGIGFSDVYIVKTWRLVAAIEGVNGVLLLGWSTAFFVTVVARLGGRP